MEIPRSVPGFVTKQLLVMNYVEGVQITRLGAQSRAQALSAVQKRLAKRRVFSRIAEAYGRMMLLEGLFNADGHPGNILVMQGVRHLSDDEQRIDHTRQSLKRITMLSHNELDVSQPGRSCTSGTMRNPLDQKERQNLPHWHMSIPWKSKLDSRWAKPDKPGLERPCQEPHGSSVILQVAG